MPPAAPPVRDVLHFPDASRTPLEPYLPPHPPTTVPRDAAPTSSSPSPSRPFVTLTFATSLDSSLSLAPGVQTALSGPASKAMTHFLRSRHDAILIGAGTAIADGPSLNCRLEGVWGYGGEGRDGVEELGGQPRPVVVDGRARWKWWGEEDGEGEAKVVRLAREGKGRGLWVVTREEPAEEVKKRLESVGGEYLVCGDAEGGKVGWGMVLGKLKEKGIRSVMIEGGGQVINELLEPGNADLVDSVIVTIAPTWLGQGGVVVSPQRRVNEEGKAVPAARLKDVKWVPLEEDVVVCGRLIR